MNITPIVNALILLLSTVICFMVVPKVRTYLEEKIGKENTANLVMWVDIFVSAAEQTLEGGIAKKNFVTEALEKMGYTITDEVDAAIEAAVLRLHEALEREVAE